MSDYGDTERREEIPPTVEKKPPLTFRERVNLQFRKYFHTRDRTRTTTYGDTERREEIPTTVEEKPVDTTKTTFKPVQPRPTVRVRDTEREEEIYVSPPRKPPPTPKITIPKGKRKPTPQKPVSTVDDTELEHEKIQVEEKPRDREKARAFTERVIEAIGPTKRRAETPEKPEYYKRVKDTERKMEIPSTVEERPPGPDRSAEILTESERAFRGVSTKLRTTALGFREEGKRKEGAYGKIAYHTVGLGLRYGASAFDVLTMPARPIFLAETALRAKTVISKPVESIGEFGKAIMEDPLGVLADIGGGFYGGHLLGLTIQRLGISRPSSYKLTEKTGYVTDIAESPAFLMPKGKFRNLSWDALKKGGTAVVQLEKRKGLASYWEPVPVYSPLSKAIPVLSGLASIKGPDIDVQTKVDQQVREILMIGKTPKPKIWVEPTTPRIIELAGYTEKEKIWVVPQITPRLGTPTIPDLFRKARTREKEDQITEVITIPTISTIPVSITRTELRTKTTKKLRLRRKTPTDITLISFSKLWGEKRRYPVATRKQLEKALFKK